MIGRPALAALAAAALVAVAMPALLLRPGAPASGAAPEARAAPLRPARPAPLVAVYERRLFAPPGEAASPADAPQLTGIVGRIGRDAVAFVRTNEGESRRLAPGDSIDGWRLESLAIDAAFFARGTERVRTALPQPDADDQ